MTVSFSMNSFEGKRILSLVREGDYAHAGEEEAIELAMASVTKVPSNLILDAGCGRGGTADYLRRGGWGAVVGIDIEPTSIEAARQTYPECEFIACDVVDVDKRLDKKVDVICMFNAFYCFRDQSRALAALAAVAKCDTQMIIFDHVDLGGYQDLPIMDSGEPFLPNPPKLSEIEEFLSESGWATIRVEEIHESYIRWYTSLVSKIEAKHDEIVELGGQNGFEHVRSLYRDLLSAAKQRRLGAAIISARPMKN